MPTAFLDERIDSALRGFLYRCSKHGVDTQLVYDLARQTIGFIRNTVREDTRWSQATMTRWYDSLAAGAPDWSVYDGDEYLSELWAGWVVHSRTYLLRVDNARSYPPFGVVEELRKTVRSVVDLGCGIGYTTAALVGLFPDARVVATNILGTMQADIAAEVGSDYGFELMADCSSLDSIDLVWATDYFEHIPKPVHHLREILHLKPQALLIANSFGTKSIGHFDSYEVDGETISAADTRKAFHRTLRQAGYRPIKTKMWNSRPRYWRKG